MVVFAGRSGSNSTPYERFERLIELPPSAKLVYRVLEEDAPMTQKGVRNEALLPARTTRDALMKLKDGNLIEERLYLPDARKRLYASLEIERPDDAME